MCKSNEQKFENKIDVATNPTTMVNYFFNAKCGSVIIILCTYDIT